MKINFFKNIFLISVILMSIIFISGSAFANPQVWFSTNPNSGYLAEGGTASFTYQFQCLGGNGNCQVQGPATVWLWGPSVNHGSLQTNATYESGGYWYTTGTYTAPSSSYSIGDIEFYYKVCEQPDGTNCNDNQYIATGFGVDATGPTGSITINDNSGYTNNSTPSLTLSATDNLTTVTDMRFSCNNSNWTSWVSYATSYSSFNIASGSNGCDTENGSKNIYVQFIDSLSNISSSYSDSTYYDTVAPSLSSITLNNYNIKGGRTATVTFTFSDASGVINNFTLVDDVTIDASSSEISGLSGSGLTRTATLTAKGVNDLVNIISVGTNWTDMAGNTASSGGSSSNYTITPPFVQSVSYNANEGSKVLSITFDDTIDASLTDLSKIHVRPTGSSSGGVTLTGATVTDVDSTTIYITTTEAQRIAIKHLATKELDLDAGAVKNTSSINFSNEADNNEAISYTEDTTRPLISSLTVNDSMLTDADVGLAKLTTTIVFNEEMNTAVFPVVEFLPDVYQTLSCGGSWSNNTTFLYTCDVTDAGVDTQGIDIRVTNARDIVTNNQMLSDTRTDLFGIDTLNPTVQNLSVNDTWIGENNVGSNTFIVTVDFSESMDTLVNPGIVFLPSVTSTLACNGIWSDSDTYSYSCDVTDSDVELQNIDIRISNAKDSRGNTMVMYTGEDMFNIDTVKPTISITNDASATWVNQDTITSNPADGIGINNTRWIVSNDSTCNATKDGSLDSGNLGTTLNANDESIYYNKYICFRTMDYAGNKQYVSSAILNRLDTSKPTTTGDVNMSANGEDGWYVTDVNFTITPSGATSGIFSTSYCIDDSNSCTPNIAYTVPLTLSADGNHYVRFYSVDNASNVQDVVSSGLIKIDQTKPTTTGSITSGTLGNNGWYTTNVDYTITPADATSDVNLTYYCVDSINTCNPTTVYYSAFVLSDEGNNYIRFRTIDNAGNVQDIQESGLIKIDKTNPITTGAVSKAVDGLNGWYVSDLNFIITPVDSISNVYFTEYCLSETSNCAPDTNYSSPILLSTEGNNYIRFRTIDNAGNVQEIQESGLIKIDKTKPLFSTWTNTLNVNEDTITIEAIDNLMFDQTFINNVLLFTINDVNKIENINFSLSDQNFLSIKYTQTFIPGDYNISIKVRDEAGNEMTYAHSYTLNVAYVYSFSFPTGDVFKTNLERGKFLKSQFEKIPSWDENYMLSDLLTSNEGPLSERSEISDFNTVYFYNSTDGWTTVDSNMFTTYNLFSNLRNENYMYFDIVGIYVPEKAIRHSLGLVN